MSFEHTNLTSEDLATIHSVYQRLCAERVLTRDPQARDDLKRELIELFLSGLRDPEALYQAYEYPLGPPSAAVTQASPHPTSHYRFRY